MITVHANFARTEGWLGRVHQAVKDSGKRIVNNTTSRAQLLAQITAPKGVRSLNKSLRGSIVKRVFSDGLNGEVFVRADNEQMAIIQEEGIAPTYVKFSEQPLLREWALAKNSHTKTLAGREGMLIGGPNSRIKEGASLNTFWDKAFKLVDSKVPQIVAHSLKQSIERLK